MFLLFMGSCSGGNSASSQQEGQAPSSQQSALTEAGWYTPKPSVSGELSKEYGVRSKYGQQDNYFDIKLGEGCDVAIKIIDANTDQCIRYVLVPENTTVNIQMIPQGQYYLKLAYGKNWMQYDNEDGSVEGKFADNFSYEKSTDIFDFGRKNSANVVSYELQINIVDSDLQNNFATTTISEQEFFN